MIGADLEIRRLARVRQSADGSIEQRMDEIISGQSSQMNSIGFENLKNKIKTKLKANIAKKMKRQKTTTNEKRVLLIMK